MRRRKLKNPIKAQFVIPPVQHHGCDFVAQDSTEHITKTIVLRSNSEAIIDLRFEPRLFFSTSEISLGCEGDVSKTPYRAFAGCTLRGGVGWP
jgi:hypothetical protein